MGSIIQLSDGPVTADTMAPILHYNGLTHGRLN